MTGVLKTGTVMSKKTRHPAEAQSLEKKRQLSTHVAWKMNVDADAGLRRGEKLQGSPYRSSSPEDSDDRRYGFLFKQTPPPHLGTSKRDWVESRKEMIS